MLTCQEVATRASALIDGDLTPLQMLGMRAHLAMCRGCARFVDQLRVTRDLTQSAAVPDHDDAANLDRITAILAQVGANRTPGG